MKNIAIKSPRFYLYAPKYQINGKTCYDGPYVVERRR